MFDLRRDEVHRAIPLPEEGALEHVVVGFRATGREYHFILVTPEERRHLTSGRHDGLSFGEGRPVRAGRIAKVTVQVRPHGRQHLGGDWRGRVVIEIDPFL